MQKFRFIFLPFSAPYVKVYLLENGVCIAKKKTKVARKTLEPLYQQLLSFEESPQGKVLQVICINTLLNLSMPPIQFPLNDFQKSFMRNLASSSVSKTCWVPKYHSNTPIDDNQVESARQKSVVDYFVCTTCAPYLTQLS